MKNNTRKFLNITLALVIAIISWTFVVYNYDPDTDVRYGDVPIIFIGEDILAERGYGISNVSRDDINVVLRQKRVDCGSIDSNDINVIANVSDAVEGDNGIALQISGPEGTQVKESEVKSVSILVERAERLDMDVVIEEEDNSDANIEPIYENLSTEYVRVTGAASLMESVDKVVAYIKSKDIKDDVRSFTREFVALDKNGDQIPHITIDPYNVTFSARNGYLKSVNVRLNVTDNENDGYVRTCEAPDKITVKGSSTDLAGIGFIDTEELYIGSLYEDTELELNYILPEGVYIADSSAGDNILKVTVAEKQPEKEEKEESESETDTEKENEHQN